MAGNPRGDRTVAAGFGVRAAGWPYRSANEYSGARGTPTAAGRRSPAGVSCGEAIITYGSHPDAQQRIIFGPDSDLRWIDSAVALLRASGSAQFLLALVAADYHFLGSGEAVRADRGAADGWRNERGNHGRRSGAG